MLPLIGVPEDFDEVLDFDDTYVEYPEFGFRSLVEIEEPTERAAIERAEAIAEAITRGGIDAAIAYGGDPEPFKSRTSHAA